MLYNPELLDPCSDYYFFSFTFQLVECAIERTVVLVPGLWLEAKNREARGFLADAHCPAWEGLEPLKDLVFDEEEGSCCTPGK